MRKLITIILFSCLPIGVVNASYQSHSRSEELFGSNVYFGLSAGNKYLNYAPIYGKNFFSRDHKSIGILFGIKDDNFSYEAMGFYSRTNKKPHVVEFLEYQLGEEAFSGIGSDTYETKVELSGLYFQGFYNYPVHNNADLLVGVGLGLVRAKYFANFILDDDLPTTPDEKEDNKVDVAKVSFVPRFSLGTLIHSEFGSVRLTLNYDFSRGLNKTFQRRLHIDAGNNIKNTINTKNSFGFDIAIII